MLTENNTLNWLRFMRLILSDKECSKKINRFISRNSHGTHQEISKRIYDRYCKELLQVDYDIWKEL